MPDALIAYLRATLPEDIAAYANSHITKLEQGEYEALLRCPEARLLFGQEQNTYLTSIHIQDFHIWTDYIFRRLEALCGNSPEKQIILFCIGYAALLAFVQSNVTGPPLEFQPSSLLLSQAITPEKDERQNVRKQLIAALTVDGIAAYKLTPSIELLCLASTVMTYSPILKNIKAARWAKMRIAFFHQRLLSEVSSTLQDLIYDDLGLVADGLETMRGDGKELLPEFVLERATVHIHHGLDKFARIDLEQAKKDRHFDFALTGLLGKRTKFQEKNTSQLVVLAKSRGGESTAESEARATDANNATLKPTNIDLNDDTLLESISFSKTPIESQLLEILTEDSLPLSLKSLDPSSQPQLQPLDSTILLLFASSITNVSPQSGLTREETLPYATRVLEGGSSNWQVYTQALLVRSRIEGYRSRTVERGLLQLQALVDQVIAETTGVGSSAKVNAGQAAPSSTFLPKAKQSESATVTERLRYVFQLATPTRWELEAELASRWVSMGGLRSALEIYERLELWAEAALCWAATERENKAMRVVRRQLYHATNGGPHASDDVVSDDEEWTGPARDPPPLDAPRLYCILGDLDQSIEMYEKAWDVSKQRYARAQRSMGRQFFAARDYVRAAEAYSKSLKVNQLNQQSWFALGCALLELAQFENAVEAFSRCVQLDETDAEGWSNLAAALLRTDPNTAEAHTDGGAPKLDDDEDESTAAKQSSAAEREQRIRKDALQALKRAASLKHDSFRIWENVLIVSASLSPPDYTSILSAQKRIIYLRGKTDGEKCIDTEILTNLVNHTIASADRYDPSQPGLTRMVVKFVDEAVVPLITGAVELWQLVAKLALWRNKPSSALDAEEKAWRAVTSQPGWDTGESEEKWGSVVHATVRLCDAYESLGPKERTEGMGAGELVAKDWRFKARSAVRSVLGKAKGGWDGTEGWERLTEAMEGLKL